MRRKKHLFAQDGIVSAGESSSRSKWKGSWKDFCHSLCKSGSGFLKKSSRITLQRANFDYNTAENEQLRLFFLAYTTVHDTLPWKAQTAAADLTKNDRYWNKLLSAFATDRFYITKFGHFVSLMVEKDRIAVIENETHSTWSIHSPKPITFLKLSSSHGKKKYGETVRKGQALKEWQRDR